MIATYHKVGQGRGSPRIWLESPRLHQLGFAPRTYLDVMPRAGVGLDLRPVEHKTKNRVSFRQMTGLDCPIIDLNSQQTLAQFIGHTELKLVATFKHLRVEPSIRSFSILQHRTRGLPIPTMEYFAGGGTLSQAIVGDARFRLAGAVELSPKFAAHYALEHPEVPIHQCDIRDLDPRDLPPVGCLIAGLPCTCFSPQGIAKKKLKGVGSELGDTGDLFVTFLHHVATLSPLAVVIENVPQFFGSSAIAGRLIMAHLERIGYHVNYFEILPYDQWGEPQSMF